MYDSKNDVELCDKCFIREWRYDCFQGLRCEECFDPSKDEIDTGSSR